VTVIRLRVAEGSFGSHSAGPSAGFGGGASVRAGRARPGGGGGSNLITESSDLATAIAKLQNSSSGMLFL